MAFSRELGLENLPSGATLTRDLIGIGFALGGQGSVAPPFERTLVAASREGILLPDFRVLSLLCLWLERHSAQLNADLLTRLVRLIKEPRIRGFWAGVGGWLKKDRRFIHLQKLYRGPRITLPDTGADFQISRHGEDPRFKKTSLKVPANLLRRRDSDVMTPVELAKTNRHYHYRILIGPTFRADLWAHLEADPALSPADLARAASASFASAWQVKRAYALLHPALP